MTSWFPWETCDWCGERVTPLAQETTGGLCMSCFETKQRFAYREEGTLVVIYAGLRLDDWWRK